MFCLSSFSVECYWHENRKVDSILSLSWFYLKLILPPWICYTSADSFSPLLLWPHTFSALPTNSHACRLICSLQYYTSDNFQDSKSWPDVSQLHICIFSCPTEIFLEMLSKRFQCYIWRISSSWPYVHPDTLSKHHVLV